MSCLKKADPHSHLIKISNNQSITDIASNQIIEEAFSGIRPDFFGMIGGPPCPDFSNGGTHAGGEGKNGQLTKVYVEKICEIKPDFFLMENVSGLFRFKKHHEFLFKQLDKLRNEGYAINYRILNALNFGVPQTRERLFIVGVKNKYIRPGMNGNDWFPWPEEKYTDAVNTFVWPPKNVFGTTPECPLEIPIELTVYHAFKTPLDATKAANGNEFFRPHSPKFSFIDEGDHSG